MTTLLNASLRAILVAALLVAPAHAWIGGWGGGGSGTPGAAGEDGLSCWDSNANGTCDAATEDFSGNGTCEAIDCQGPPGAEGAAGQPGVPGYSPNQILGGGGVAWTSGLSVIVSATQYVIGGTVYSAPQTELTVGAADGDFGRFDLIVVNTDGEAEVVAGTPAATPVTPEIDPATQIQLAIVEIAADATELTNAVNETVYEEHSGEWGTNASGNWDADNTLNPRSGSKAVRANAAAIGSYIRFNKTGGADFAAYDNLVGYVRIASWPNNKNLILQALNSGGTPHGAAVLLANNSFGLSASNTTDYQQVVIPAALFQAGGLDTRYLRVQVGGTGGGSVSLFLDDIVFQVGVQGSALASSAMTYRDTWSAAPSYPKNSVVTHEGSTYVALTPSIGVEPGTNAAVWQPTVTDISGNAATATALAANGANCSAGNYPLGVDASGAVESCTAAGGASNSVPLATKTSSYVLTTSDSVILCDATSGTVTISTNQAASNFCSGSNCNVFTVKKIDSSANSCTIDPNSTETIDGATTKTNTTQYQSFSFTTNGTNWFIY